MYSHIHLNEYIRLSKCKNKLRNPNERLRYIQYNYYFYKKLNKIKKKDFEIVIAKYNENIDWCKCIEHLVTIYDKNDISKNIIDKKYGYINKKIIKLPNVGRESHTYLYHIIKNWNNLAEKTLFIQGKIEDHSILPIPLYCFNQPEMIAHHYFYNIHFKDGEGNHIKHIDKWLKEYDNGLIKSSNMTFNEFWLLLNNTPVKHFSNLKWCPGAIFSVSKKLIKSRSLDFYKQLLDIVNHHKNPEEGHYFERCWYYIFHPNVKI